MKVKKSHIKAVLITLALLLSFNIIYGAKIFAQSKIEATKKIKFTAINDKNEGIGTGDITLYKIENSVYCTSDDIINCLGNDKYTGKTVFTENKQGVRTFGRGYRKVSFTENSKEATFNQGNGYEKIELSAPAVYLDGKFMVPLAKTLALLNADFIPPTAFTEIKILAHSTILDMYSYYLSSNPVNKFNFDDEMGFNKFDRFLTLELTVRLNFIDKVFTDVKGILDAGGMLFDYALNNGISIDSREEGFTSSMAEESIKSIMSLSTFEMKKLQEQPLFFRDGNTILAGDSLISGGIDWIKENGDSIIDNNLISSLSEALKEKGYLSGASVDVVNANAKGLIKNIKDLSSVFSDELSSAKSEKHYISTSIFDIPFTFKDTADLMQILTISFDESRKIGILKNFDNDTVDILNKIFITNGKNIGMSSGQINIAKKLVEDYENNSNAYIDASILIIMKSGAAVTISRMDDLAPEISKIVNQISPKVIEKFGTIKAFESAFSNAAKAYELGCAAWAVGKIYWRIGNSVEFSKDYLTALQCKSFSNYSKIYIDKVVSNINKESTYSFANLQDLKTSLMFNYRTLSRVREYLVSGCKNLNMDYSVLQRNIDEGAGIVADIMNCEIPNWKTKDNIEKNTKTIPLSVFDSPKIEVKIENNINDSGRETVTLYGVTEKGERLWNFFKRNIIASEVESYSKINADGDRVLVVIDGTLYNFAKNTGYLLWEVAGVGTSIPAPVVDSQGNIYVAGKDEPFLSAVSSDGRLLWRKSYGNSISNSYEIKIEDNNLVVTCEGTPYDRVCVFDKTGSLLSSKVIVNDSNPPPEANYSPLNPPSSSVTSSSSSYLPDKTIAHIAAHAFDKNLNTAWVEGAAGDGINEWIMGTFPMKAAVSSFEIVNGYTKTIDTYKNNNRVKKIKVEFSGGESYTYDVADKYIEYQKFTLNKAVLTDYIKITILEVYKGAKYDDTCISEIKANN